MVGPKYVISVRSRVISLHERTDTWIKVQSIFTDSSMEVALWGYATVGIYRRPNHSTQSDVFQHAVIFFVGTDRQKNC
jgi:hypothetical protein